MTGNNQPVDAERKMKLPNNPELPLFVYGIFKPGQLGFYQIEDLVEKCTPYKIPAKLYERDGVPLLKLGGNFGLIQGYIITFVDSGRKEAYLRIVAMEPHNQYKWGTHETSDGSLVNVLIGRRLNKGSHYFEYNDWDGKKDPLFNEALALIDAICISKFKYSDALHDFSEPIYRIFHLQMAYMLLWSAIERYGSLKYGLNLRPTEKYKKIADEEAFKVGLRKYVTEDRIIYRADEPRKAKHLDINDSEKSIDYYYQIRCNSVHRGKSVFKDESLIEKSLMELQSIFKDMLAASFGSDA